MPGYATGIIPVGVQMTILGSEARTQVGCLQDKHRTIAPAL